MGKQISKDKLQEFSNRCLLELQPSLSHTPPCWSVSWRPWWHRAHTPPPTMAWYSNHSVWPSKTTVKAPCRLTVTPARGGTELPEASHPRICPLCQKFNNLIKSGLAVEQLYTFPETSCAISIHLSYLFGSLLQWQQLPLYWMSGLLCVFAF